MKDAEIFLQEIKIFREKHKIIDVPFIPPFLVPEKLSLANKYKIIRLIHTH